MGKILILNGSPRAPKSNSKHYAALFTKYCPVPCDTQIITRRNHAELCKRMADCSDLLFVFPLYADALPVGLLEFLRSLEEHLPERRPVVSVLINCGFQEVAQNEVAVEMMRLFCRRNGFRFGSVLMIGSGEAILESPFRFLVKRKIRRLARSVARGLNLELHTTMPLPKWLFRIASTLYWTEYGRRFGVSREQMQTPRIEG